MLKNNKKSLLSDGKTTNPFVKPSIPIDCEWGVDWLTFGFYVNADSIDVTSPVWTVNGWKNAPEPGVQYKTYRWLLQLPNTVVKIYLNVMDSRCWVEVNPSNLVFGKTRDLISPDDCHLVVEAVLGAMKDHVIPDFDLYDENQTLKRSPNWKDEVVISRIDCARNLLIKDPFRFKQAIERAIPRNQKTKFKYENGAKGWGVVNQTAECGKDQIYDKDVELSLHKTNEILHQHDGTWFRFETQLRKKRIPKFGLSRLSGITAENVWNAILTRWLACRWDVTFAEPGTAAKAISHLSTTEKKGVIAYLGMHALGFGGELAKSADITYGALARDLGFVIGETISDQGKASQKLDITLGEVVLM